MNDIYDQLLVKKDDLEIKFNDGIQLERQRIAANKIDFEIPSQYKELLLLSNGFAVLDYNCEVYKLKESIELSMINEDRTINLRKLDIGMFWGDSIYIDQNNMISISFQGIDDPVDINMTFKAFLQKNIDRDFEIFWDEEINVFA